MPNNRHISDDNDDEQAKPFNLLNDETLDRRRITELPSMGTKQARAIMDYEPVNSNEMAIFKNDVHFLNILN